MSVDAMSSSSLLACSALNDMSKLVAEITAVLVMMVVVDVNVYLVVNFMWQSQGVRQ